MRLLAVGDDRKLLSFLVRALREDAYAVDTALGAERALEVARSVPYDLILLDLRLRGSSGIRVCSELRKYRIRTPIMLLAGDSLVDERVEGLNAGADDCLPKPFAVPELRARVCALIRRSKDRDDGNARIADRPSPPVHQPGRSLHPPDGKGIRSGRTSHDAQPRHRDSQRNH
jgi:DNA-binding response OmpR family regulator